MGGHGGEGANARKARARWQRLGFTSGRAAAYGRELGAVGF
jgi:hypothetical protein